METLDSLRRLEAEIGATSLERAAAGKPFTLWLWAHGRKRHGTGLPCGEGPEKASYVIHYADSPEDAAEALRDLASSAEAAAEKLEALT